MTRGFARNAAAIATLLAACAPACADLKLCNRMSYIVEIALGVEDKGAAATRGWFRIDPGQCRIVLQGAIETAHLYVHARALSVYGPSPLPQSGHADLCIATANFIIAGAKTCARSGQRLARFTEIKPSETEQGHLATLAEEADYTDEQARLAGIQRLLVMAGYDANPVDGLSGPKTEAALSQFLKERSLPVETAGAINFFDRLVEAAQRPEGAGFAWCNDTAHPVMASLGIDGKDGIVTRGWYRVEAGKCLRPEIKGQRGRVYSYGEAVDADDQVVQRGGKALIWGGDKMLCTRDVKFELDDHGNCAAGGLTATGFAIIDIASRGGIVRFKE